MDRRVKRTKKAIKEAFFYFLEKKEISKITIFDISERADIGRGTFYSHYKDIYDLYDQIEAETFEQFDLFYSQTFPSSNPAEIIKFIEQIIDYVYKRKSLFNVMVNPEDTFLMSKKVRDFFTLKIFEEIKDQPDLEEYSIRYTKIESLFIASGVVGVIENWIEKGMIENPRDISTALQQLLLKLDD